MRFAAALAVMAATLGAAIAQDTFILGFNAGASDDTGKAKTQADFEKEFKTAKSLQGAPGNFSAIRLYSNIQWNTVDTPIAAFAAAVSTKTKLLLGIWASGTDNIDNELKALNSAVQEYGTSFTDLIIGLSVGSEDLYRVSEPGIRNKAGVGNSAETIVSFIKTTRASLAKTALSKVKITHVDTWTAWVNSSNKAVIDNIDFLSVNAFPFYESELDNKISNAGALLSSAISATEGVAGGKDVWITETGWAYSGPSFGAAQATVNNAGSYWKDVGCALFGKKNVFWYTLRDANPANKVKFAITQDLSTTPRFNLTCDAKKTLPSSTPSTNTSTSSGGSNSNTTGSSNSGTSSSTNSSTNSSSGSSSGSGSSNTGAGSSVSVNGMAMVLSAVFAVAAFAL